MIVEKVLEEARSARERADFLISLQEDFARLKPDANHYTRRPYLVRGCICKRPRRRKTLRVVQGGRK